MLIATVVALLAVVAALVIAVVTVHQPSLAPISVPVSSTL